MSIYRGRTGKEFYLAALLYDSIDDRDLSSIKSLLIEKGADPNIVLPKKGISPFHLIIGCETTDFAFEVITIILQSGGDPNVRSDEGLTPVHIAAAWGRLEILNLLLTNGGDPEARDMNYMTPFHYARKENFKAGVDLLRSYLTNKSEIIREKQDCESIDLMLDKILVNNGSTIGEYEIVNEYKTDSIKLDEIRDLTNLPEASANDNVLSWFKKHVDDTGEKTYVKLPTLTDSSTDSFNSFESSVDESENERLVRNGILDISFRKSYKKKRKVSKDNTVTNNLKKTDTADSIKTVSREFFLEKRKRKENSLDLIEFSNESGIFVMPSSLRDELLDYDKNYKNMDVSEKTQNRSSQYMSCINENTNFDITNDLEPLITSDESKDVAKSERSYNAKSEGIGSNDLSFVSVSEVYRYEDKDEGIVLYERRFLKTPSECNESMKSSSFSSKMSSLPETIEYDTDTLRNELTARGYNPGPITITTKRVYLKKLFQLKKQPPVILRNETSSKKVYSIELEKTIRIPNWSTNMSVYKALDDIVVKQFSSPDPTRKWREGLNKSSFTYLLLDPRISNNLPSRSELLQPKEIWETFLSAIFYVGKGKRARPYSHLYEAVTLWKQEKYDNVGSKKLQAIIDIWRSEGGVICLHVFQNTIPAEAYTREAAMISALKIDNVTNAKSGDFYGLAATWSSRQKKMYGVYLLYKAMMIFLNEGERQLSPADID